MDPEVKKILDNFEGRLKVLERVLLKQGKNPLGNEKDTKGIPKGVQEILEEGFFNTPRTVKEAKFELEKKGHFGSEARIDTVIRRDFFKRKKLLTRIKDGSSWKYSLLK